MIPPYEIKKIENGRKKVMGEIIQQLINGLSMGSIYALIALGYTMVYGILKLRPLHKLIFYKSVNILYFFIRKL